MDEKVPLCVPPWDEAQALNQGAAYDPEVGFYVPEHMLADDFYEWLPRKWRYPGKPVLIPEILPVSSWEKNLRYILHQEQWDALRRYCYAAAGYRCEICGARASPHLECHEAWEFNDATKVQRMRGLLCLDPLCHKAHHLGFANSSGMLKDVLEHIREVNHWNKGTLDTVIKRVREQWKQRTKDGGWTVDLSWLENSDYRRIAETAELI